jgi:hypothetical protein
VGLRVVILLFKGIVQRILRGVNNQIIRPRKLEARPFFFLNFKETPSQEEHKTIFRGLKINKDGFVWLK